MLYDIYRNQKIGQAEAKASASLNQAERVADHVADLEERVDKMALLNMALWTLLKKKMGLTEEELALQVQALDLQDGVLDGKIHGQPQDCPQCARTLHQRHRSCLYCGFEMRQGGFEAVTR